MHADMHIKIPFNMRNLVEKLDIPVQLYKKGVKKKSIKINSFGPLMSSKMSSYFSKTQMLKIYGKVMETSMTKTL